MLHPRRHHQRSVLHPSHHLASLSGKGTPIRWLQRSSRRTGAPGDRGRRRSAFRSSCHVPLPREGVRWASGCRTIRRSPRSVGTLEAVPDASSRLPLTNSIRASASGVNTTVPGAPPSPGATALGSMKPRLHPSRRRDRRPRLMPRPRRIRHPKPKDPLRLRPEYRNLGPHLPPPHPLRYLNDRHPRSRWRHHRCAFRLCPLAPNPILTTHFSRCDRSNPWNLRTLSPASIQPRITSPRR